MDQNQLLSSAVELGLDLLEKNGSFIPFCKAVSESGETFVYTAGGDGDFTYQQAYESVLFNVKRDLCVRNLKGVVFCFNNWVRFSGSDEKIPAVEVQLHYKAIPAAIWYFPYLIEEGKATVLNYYTDAVKDNLFG